MAYRGITLMECPNCNKHGVSIRMRNNGEDHFGCRYCDWFAYCDGFYIEDVMNRQLLRRLNPRHELAPAKEEEPV